MHKRFSKALLLTWFPGGTLSGLIAVLGLAAGLAAIPSQTDARSCAAHSCRIKLAALRRQPDPPASSNAPVAGSKATPAGTKAAPGAVLSRTDILASDPDALERIGRHLVVGYELHSTLRALVEKRAIAGIFITDHNVRRRPADAIKADIDELQAIRAAQGLPPLIVTADQEGGSVSRLSPPLKQQPSLARILAKAKTDAERELLVRAFAATQAAELKRIGVTMNFSPVVDLNLASTRRNDGETRLKTRAITADPDLVANVAGWYCDVLASSGIMCTMKHFPGLGRVGIDTHRTTGEIRATESQLRVRDWVPFIKLMNRPNVATMLAHVRLTEVDKETPASYSRHVISGMMRDGWQHDGILITDDFSMGAVVRGKYGVGEAAVQALNAGADLVLVSFADKHLNEVMTRLLRADSEGRIDGIMREKSAARIKKTMKQAQELAVR